jgi:hypothetical protein
MGGLLHHSASFSVLMNMWWTRNKKGKGYFSGVFRGRPRGRTVDKIVETDAIRACHSGEPIAR